jgi:hypothetical protein
MNPKPPRSLHDKEHFLQGNRQRWLVMFLGCMFVILLLDAFHYVEKVDSYLTFLTFLSGSFILGYSGTETMKLFSVNSTSQNINNTNVQDTTTSQNVNSNIVSNATTTNTNINITETLTHNTKEDDYKI